MAQGFDSFFGFYSGWIDYYSHRYYTLGGEPLFHDLWRNDTEVFEEPAYQTELLGKEAAAFIQKQTTAQPFFLYLAFGAPHYPMMAPAKYLDRFPTTMDRDRRLHLAMIAALDDAVQVVRTAIEAQGLAKDTIVFFMSDNGATHEVRADHRGRPYEGGSNKPFRAWKGSLFEGGTRVPAILAHPGRITPRIENSALAAMDLMPTLLRIAGAKPPNDIDGLDLSALLLQNSSIVDRTIFWDYEGQSAARSGPWKLLTSYREGLGMPMQKGPWLSNLATDPSESKNLTADHPEMVAKLTDAIMTWRAKYL